MERIIQGDCREVMRRLIGQGLQVDSIVTDPPYELGFMGKRWDRSGVAFDPATWRLALQLLKPGGHLLAFAGSRTYHRIACAIEDAGFEVRDQIMWLYGSGFPKSMNVSKAIDKAAGAERKVISSGKAVKRMIPGADQNVTGSWIKDNGREYVPTVTAAATPEAAQWQGWGTALKPAHEPIVVARKPLAAGTVAANVLAHGTGALNIDGCRVATSEDTARVANGAMRGGNFGAGGTAPGPVGGGHEGGRWPANVIHDGSDEVLAEFARYGEKGAAAPVHQRNGDKFRNSYGAFAGNIDEAGSTFHADKGTAARFFYCAKASKADRGAGNTHPTVKPTELMRYLCRLVTPPGGRVLDPFMGSGSTGRGALLEGFDFTGIEQEPDYQAIAQARIAAASKEFLLS